MFGWVPTCQEPPRLAATAEADIFWGEFEGLNSTSRSAPKTLSASLEAGINAIASSADPQRVCLSASAIPRAKCLMPQAAVETGNGVSQTLLPRLVAEDLNCTLLKRGETQFHKSTIEHRKVDWI